MKSLHYPLAVSLSLGLFLGAACSQSDSIAGSSVSQGAETEPASVPKTSAPPASATAENAAEPTHLDPYPKALEMGMSAATVAQNAHSLDDWDLVISRWQTAIELLKAVPESSKHYATAQQKIKDYENNAAIARQHRDDLTTVVPIAANQIAPGVPSAALPQSSPPALVASSTSSLCQGAIPGGNSVVLSNFQFVRDEFESENEDYMVGCVTNRGNRSVEIYNLSYTTEGAGVGFGSTSLDMQQRTLAPGQSLPWRSGFSFSDSVDLIHLASLAVKWENGDSETIELAKTINH